MAPRRSRAEQNEERLRIMEDRTGQLLKRLISQEVKRQMQLTVSQMHQGPSNPMITSSYRQQSSCASASPPEMDWAHHPVDDITAQQPCQLYVQVCNISIKVALGMAYPVEPRQLFHDRKILPGYSRIRLDESPRSKELVVAAPHDAQCDEDDASSDNQDHDHFDEDENVLVHRHTAAPSVHTINITTTQNDDAPLSAHDTLVIFSWLERM